MKHEKEIIRWAECPEGTKVWYRKRGHEWKETIGPLWHTDHEYIIADKYAEIRKAEKDGETILFNGKEASYTLEFTDDIKNYSTKKYFTPVLKRSLLTDSIFCFVSEESAYLISEGKKDSCNELGDLVKDLKSVYSNNWEDT